MFSNLDIVSFGIRHLELEIVDVSAPVSICEGFCDGLAFCNPLMDNVCDGVTAENPGKAPSTGVHSLIHDSDFTISQRIAPHHTKSRQK